METTLTTLLCVALIPAFLLLVYIYRQDKVEKEPISLLLWVFFQGFVIIPPFAILLENLLTGIFACLTTSEHLLEFLNVSVSAALVEESLKYGILRRTIWKHPEFNEHFDGIVYAVYVSLGFAAMENLIYVFSEGMETGILRAVLSIPGHFLFAIAMGFFFAMAKFHPQKRGFYNIASLVCPMLLHGCYNGMGVFVGMLDEPTSAMAIGLIILYSLLMWVIGLACIRHMKRLTLNDPPALQKQANEAFQNTDTDIELAPASQQPAYPAQNSPYVPVKRSKEIGYGTIIFWLFIFGFVFCTFTSLFCKDNIEHLQFQEIAKKYGAIDTELQKQWETNWEQYHQGQMSADDWAQWLETEYLPPWKKLQTRLDHMSGNAFQAEYNRVKMIADGRIAYTQKFIQAVQENSPEKIQEACIMRLRSDYLDVVKFQIENGERVDAVQLNENLHYAALLGDQEMCSLLLSNGADFDSRDASGKTALDIAMESSHLQLVEILQNWKKKREEAATQEEYFVEENGQITEESAPVPQDDSPEDDNEETSKPLAAPTDATDETKPLPAPSDE